MNRALHAAVVSILLLGATGCRCGATIHESSTEGTGAAEGTSEAPVETPVETPVDDEITFEHENADFLYERVTVLMEEVRTGLDEGRDVTTACLAAAAYARSLLHEPNELILAAAEETLRFCHFELPLTETERLLATAQTMLEQDPTADVGDQCFLAGAKLRHVESSLPDDARVVAARAEHSRLCQ